MTVEDVWVHFTPEHLDEYSRHTDKEAASSHLATVLSLPEYRFNARHAIRLDYASYVLEFAREQKYGPTRTASLFRISQRVLEACIGGATLTDGEATLKADLLAVCRPKAGPDSPHFSPDQIARIGIFFASTLFHHYRLYQYCFNRDQELTEYTASLMVETAVIPSMDEAISEAEYMTKLEEARTEAEASRKAAEDAEVAKAEAARQERLEREKAAAAAARQAELAKKPATLEEAVEQMVAMRLEQEKVVLEGEYKAREEALLSKIHLLEAKVEPAAGEEKEKEKEKTSAPQSGKKK